MIASQSDIKRKYKRGLMKNLRQVLFGFSCAG